MRTRGSILDFPRAKLSSDIWETLPHEPFPKLKPELRSLILKESRYRLAQFGAKLEAANLYGGAAGYQYHPGGDIDVSLYIDWDKFKGDGEILRDAMKAVEIPWGEYVLHLFVKPEDQQERVEVADAYYDVMKDKWKLPPLILPKDFDPNIYFQPFLEQAEQEAQDMDLALGHMNREFKKLKTAVQAKRDGARDPEVVQKRIDLQKHMLKDSIDQVVDRYLEIRQAREDLHLQLRKRMIQDESLGRFERFQPAEIVWKYLDEAGYGEYLKILSQACRKGVLDELIDQI